MATNGLTFVLNPTSWTALSSMPSDRDQGAQGNCTLVGTFIQSCGTSNGSTKVDTNFAFNLTAWSSLSASNYGTRNRLHATFINNFMYLQGGLDAAGPTALAAGEKYNGTAFSTYTAGTSSYSGSAVSAPDRNVWLINLGEDSTVVDKVWQVTLAEAFTNLGASAGGVRTGVASGRIGPNVYRLGGSSTGVDAQATATSIAYNGSSFSAVASFATARTKHGCAYGPSGMSVIGGTNTGSTVLSSIEQFNGTSWTTAVPQYGQAATTFGGMGSVGG